jgi:NhaA family Na+:H+ antiporter
MGSGPRSRVSGEALTVDTGEAGAGCSPSDRRKACQVDLSQSATARKSRPWGEARAMDGKMRGPESQASEPIPPRPIERMLTPFERFLHVEAASGVVLLGCTLVALALANSRLAADYQAFWEQPVRVSLGRFGLDYPLWYWVNDGLMTLFFFVIGLEIKRELVHGELSDARKVLVPVACALGGAIAPALVFFALQPGGPAARAWAVPMATDIAFVVGCLSLFGKRVPRGLKIFLLSLAIVDDILAVLVIAAFYSAGLNLGALAGAAGGFAIIVALNRLGVRTVSAYVFMGTVTWLFMLKSGIHPTVAGVALGLLTPASAWLGDRSLLDVLRRTTGALEARAGSEAARRDALGAVRFAAREAASPLERLETGLHPWVGFVIMPAFALANAGVAIGTDTLAEPLAVAVASGLVLGKPIGIVLAAVVVVKAGWSSLPEGAGWRAMFASGCLAGIGFTMSLFVASLGLQGELLAEAKGGVLVGSALSLCLGMGVLHLTLPSGAALGAAEHAPPVRVPETVEAVVAATREKAAVESVSSDVSTRGGN